MKSDGCDLVVLGTVIRETIGAMSEAKKLGWDVTFLGATPTNVLEVPTLGKEAVEGLYAASGFEIPYEDTAKGKVKDWLANYKKMFNADANTQAIIGYNSVTTFAHYVNKAGKDLTGQKVLDSLEFRRQVPRHLQLAADQVHQDRPSRQHRDPGPADQERPLGAGKGKPVVLRVTSPRHAGEVVPIAIRGGEPEPPRFECVRASAPGPKPSLRIRLRPLPAVRASRRDDRSVTPSPRPSATTRNNPRTANKRSQPAASRAASPPSARPTDTRRLKPARSGSRPARSCWRCSG